VHEQGMSREHLASYIILLVIASPQAFYQTVCRCLPHLFLMELLLAHTSSWLACSGAGGGAHSLQRSSHVVPLNATRARVAPLAAASIDSCSPSPYLSSIVLHLSPSRASTTLRVLSPSSPLPRFESSSLPCLYHASSPQPVAPHLYHASPQPVAASSPQSVAGHPDSTVSALVQLSR
jgi:hypothetical protein